MKSRPPRRPPDDPPLFRGRGCHPARRLRLSSRARCEFASPVVCGCPRARCEFASNREGRWCVLLSKKRAILGDEATVRTGSAPR
jgi:hypothetical protein